MLNKNEFAAYMARHEYTHKSLAKKMGMTERTFANRMKSGIFRSDEIELLINLLQISNPMEIFFAVK